VQLLLHGEAISITYFSRFHPFWTSALERGERSASRPGRFLPPEKTRYQLYRRLGGPQDRSGQVRKISPPPGSDPRPAQPVASRYTEYYIFSGRICSFRYPAYNAHMFYCRLWPARLYKIFPYCHKGLIFEGKLLNPKCMF
jgi:hypothetical protein